MAIMRTDSANYSTIADAIRAKGVTGNFKPNEMAEAISAIVSGGGGSVEYVPTVLNVINGTERSKYIITYQTYGYIQALEMIWEFEEPTTKELYLIGMTTTGIAKPEVFFDNATIAADTCSSLRNGDGKAYQSITIPIGTKKVRFTDSNYVTSYQMQCGFYISETSIGSGTNVSTYLDVWNAGTPIDMVSIPLVVTATYNESKVILGVDKVTTPESIETEIPGYLKVTIDDTEYIIYEAEGGTY